MAVAGDTGSGIPTCTAITLATPGMARSRELTTSFIAGLREIMRSGRSARSARNVLSACNRSRGRSAAAKCGVVGGLVHRIERLQRLRDTLGGGGRRRCGGSAVEIDRNPRDEDLWRGSRSVRSARLGVRPSCSLANDEKVQHVPAVAQVGRRIRDEEARRKNLRDHLSRERDSEGDVDGTEQLPKEACVSSEVGLTCSATRVD